ncbi:hypothetical protein BT69DRAFT_148526 [Atractiella rhizophila]|nr:hypothetical protein BT69DRAFT_148526 [Atractiella rhizophila]
MVVEEQRGLAYCICGMGMIEQGRGRNKKALKRFEEAKELYVLVEDQGGLADCIRGMGMTERDRGRNEEALKRFEEAKELYMIVKNQRGLAHCISSIGEIEQGCAQNEEALGWFEEAKELYVVVEDVAGQLNCLANMASVYEEDHQVNKAIDLLWEMINLSMTVGGYYEAHSRGKMGRLLFRLSMHSEARKETMHARQLYAECSAASDITNCDKLLEAIAGTEKGSDVREGPLGVTEQVSSVREGCASPPGLASKGWEEGFETARHDSVVPLIDT